MSTAATVRTLGNLRIPLVSAPMFIISGPELIIAAARAGIVGAMPSLNARTPEILDGWLDQIGSALNADRKAGRQVGLPALNILVHRSNERFAADVDVCVNHRVPVVVAAIGNPERIIEPVHRYGGMVLADVSSVAHARKAAAAGCDGLVLLCSGAGGNTGRLNPFAFVEEVRSFFDGPIGVAGSVANGRALRAMEVLGADFGYAGTSFIACEETGSDQEYRQMVVDAGADDIEENSQISGIPANFLRRSLDKARDQLDAHQQGFSLAIELKNLRRWKDIWGAGHGVGSVHAVEPVSAVVERFEREYREAGGQSGWR